MADRTATVTRNTLESQITVTVNLDGTGQANFATPVPFLEHMMDQIARHGLVDLDISRRPGTPILMITTRLKISVLPWAWRLPKRLATKKV